MSKLSRRTFLKAASAATLLSAVPGTSSATIGLSSKKVVIVGGGFAGATAAKYLRHWSDVDVTLIEANASYNSCILSNLVLTGERQLDSITFNYDSLKSKYGINVLEDTVAEVDTANQQIFLGSDTGKTSPVSYDRLILAPGVEFKFPSWNIDFDTVPHAWKAGPQIGMLKAEIDSLQNGDTFVLRVPKNPYRCPPGPYERVCAIADYLSHQGKSVDIKVVDINGTLNGGNVMANVFGDLFGVGKLYPNVEYIAGEDITDIDSGKLVTLSGGSTIQAGAVNYIPDQRAPAIVRDTLHPGGGDWASVDLLSYASTSGEPNAGLVHVIGDAHASPQPKAGHIANAEAKICADAIIRTFINKPLYQNPMTSSACFTPINSTEAAWISAVFRYDGSGMATQKIGNSPTANNKNYQLMFKWANNLFADTFS